jgi:hypothetical protein
MLENLQPPDSSRSCRIGSILADLDKNDKTILSDALNDPVRWSSHGLMIALKERGISVSIHPILNHRRGICKCSKI